MRAERRVKQHATERGFVRSAGKLLLLAALDIVIDRRGQAPPRDTPGLFDTAEFGHEINLMSLAPFCWAVASERKPSRGPL